MPTNDFKVYAGGGGANVESQATYVADSQLAGGATSGLARSAFANKVWRQCSIIASMIAQFIVDKAGTDALDDGTTATLETNFIAAITGMTRIKLAADLNLYVATTGNDSNSGLAVGSPFLTLQHAADVALRNYDHNGHNVIINVAAGTYTVGASCLGRAVGQTASIQFVGAGTASTFVTLAAAGYCFLANLGAVISVNAMKLSAPIGATGDFTLPGICLAATNSSIINLGASLSFGTTQHAHMRADQGSSIFASNGGAYSITGGAEAHIFAGSPGVEISITGAVVTVTGTPAFSNAFAVATANSMIYANSGSTTISGAATGTRYTASIGGVIATQGGGANFFPGSVAGSSTTGYYT